MVFLWFRRPSLFPTQTFSLLMLALTPVEPVCFREFFQAPFPPFIASQKLNISSSRWSCGRNVYVVVLLRFWPTIKSRRTLSTVSGRQTFLCNAVSDPRSERNMVVVDSEQYLFIRTPHQRYSQCVSWRFKPLSFRWRSCGLRESCSCCLRSQPSFSQWFTVFFYCILAYIYLYLNHGFIFLFIGECLLIEFLSHYSFLSQIPTTLYSLYNSIWCWRNNNHVIWFVD